MVDEGSRTALPKASERKTTDDASRYRHLARLLRGGRLMSTTYDVRVHELHKRYDNGSRKPTRYVVRWAVDRRRKERGFKLSAQADSFRSELMTAARKGEPF